MVPAQTQQVIHGYEGNGESQELISEVGIAPKKNSDYQYQNGVIKCKPKIFIGQEMGVRSKIIEALHASKPGKHYGAQASYLKAEQFVYWPGIHMDIKESIRSCDVCRRSNEEHVPYPGLLSIPGVALSRTS